MTGEPDGGSDQIRPYRSAISDALGRPIPGEGDLKLWLDDDVEDRQAPEGWVHLVSAREVCFLLLTGRVTNLSLDHDLSDDVRFGSGSQVIDFLDEQHGVYDRNLWPREITIHSANASGRKRMSRAIRHAASRRLEVEETLSSTGKPVFTLRGLSE